MTATANPPSYDTIAGLLATERYNPNIVPQLEAYVEEQAKTCTYHFQANLTLTKLYQFFPDLLAERADILGLVFALSLANWKPPMPVADTKEDEVSTFTDSLQLSYVVDAEVQEKEGPISAVIRCVELLESCNYPPLWSDSAALPAVLSDPSLSSLNPDSLKAHIRRSILLSLACTYKSAPVSVVLDALGYSPSEAPDFMSLAAGEASDVISAVNVAGRSVEFAPMGGPTSVNRKRPVGGGAKAKGVDFTAIFRAMAVASDQ
eukprot:CAMPEP_0194265620 /NCGR_PEP_ID=MMETSP0169-20130528/797_1 /TAXON_ID=218684 /ORGANISM="Corethron pennatum, Strain L29A3" /LENGTH=261 /DNA_ID=CAMNT_0039006125 /DNA_START=96 /DNA_END=881 /DNA_ORIENTATION=-